MLKYMQKLFNNFCIFKMMKINLGQRSTHRSKSPKNCRVYYELKSFSFSCSKICYKNYLLLYYNIFFASKYNTSL